MMSKSGKNVPNQFEISIGNKTYFQSYDTIIAKVDHNSVITLDKNNWDSSNTTNKYRNIFLGKTTKEIVNEIKTKQIKLKELNK